MRRRNSIVVFAVILTTVVGTLSAQSFDRLTLPVRVDNKTLPLALAGGLNNPQLSAADLNDDGVKDLYIFDRNGQVHLPFLRSGEDLVFAPEYARYFPAVRNWILLRDYNQDGAADIFAYSDVPGIPGIQVYTGFFENGRLSFRRLPLGNPYNLLYFPLPGGGSTQLFVSNIDYPAVDDIDCDGDLDILTFNAAGGYIELYQNQSVERGYGLDSLIFELADDCWGGIFESGITPEVDLANNPGECATSLQGQPPVRVRHAGSTLLTLDADGDSDRELVLGDLSFPGVNFLHNAGTCEQAWIDNQSLQFPADMPVDLPFFPVAFYLDLSGDGVADLAFSPNAVQESENVDVIWFYENKGTENTPDLEFRRRDFLVGNMLDLGSGAHPAFVDYNADGLTDLVIGNGFRFSGPGKRPSSLFLFENTGTSSQPAFELVDRDYLGLSRFNPEHYQYAPVFGDLDGDGDLDVLAGEVQGGLFYAENVAGPGRPLEFGPWQYPFLGIDVGQSSTPAFGDLNGDGLPDLLAGERNGNINYFQNQGTVTDPIFDPDPQAMPNTFFLGSVDTRIPGSIVGFSAPVVLTQNGIPVLLTGSDEGMIEVYTGIENKLYDAFTLAHPEWGNIREGFRTHPALADIDRDGMLELVAGNARGGIAFYKTDLRSEQTVAISGPVQKEDLRLSPNPARDRVVLALQTEKDPFQEKQVIVFSSTGKVVLRQPWPETSLSLDIAMLLPGVYFVKIQFEEKIITKKLIVYK